METIKLPFIPRRYQLPAMQAFEKYHYRKLLLVWARRSGKDALCFNLALRAVIEKPMVVYIVFPTYSQAKKAAWDSITSENKRFLDYIPPQLIHSKNSQEMKIRLKNESLIQFIGSDNIDSIMGTNPQGVIFSEYALQNERAYNFLRPILAANKGWVIFQSTPRGKQNHFYKLYQMALQSPTWFVQKLTLDDTKHIDPAEIEDDRREGRMTEDLILQEYYCSFTAGIEGAYYAKYYDRMVLNNQITNVPWQPAFRVRTSFDLGIRDSTSIIFFQQIGPNIHVIDCYENNNEGLEHYAALLKSKPYQYDDYHIAPHDIKVREFSTGMTRIEKASQLGINFIVADNISIADGIEAVRTTLPKMYIDKEKCKPLLDAIQNYRKEWDSINKVYKNHPLHDKHSHMADSLRYLSVSLPKLSDDLTAEDMERNYREVMYGAKSNLPPFFR